MLIINLPQIINRKQILQVSWTSLYEKTIQLLALTKLQTPLEIFK